MVITRVSPIDLIRSMATSLGLDAADARLDSDSLLAALVRRIAGSLCPCSPATLASAVCDSLQSLTQAPRLKDQVDDVIESLLVMGDLLELSQVTIDNAEVRGTWVFIAPPSFVERPNKGVLMTGISADETTPLPSSLAARIQYEGVARLLYPVPGEDLTSVLRDLGLVGLSSKHWLRAPAPVHPQTFSDDMRRRLADQPPSGAIAELSILDPSARVTHYRSRWIAPTDQTGYFVARRPQAYGAPLWGLAHLTGGLPSQFLDFPLKEFPFRGCDVAWHTQMAIDASRNNSQRYRIRSTAEGSCLDFFSPLPLWADRRLRIFGRPVATQGCLSSYLISDREIASEARFLQEYLWLERDDRISEEYA